MQERSLRVVKTDKTFFSKISNTLTRFLIPTKLSFNSVLITLKRNNLIKAFEIYDSLKEGDESKREALQNRYEEAYTLYLESIDKFIMDSIYKKVKNGAASAFERDALSKYYMIVQLKDSEYNEYKHKKQKFLLELDYESLKSSKKEKTIIKFNKLYLKKMDILYKGILKNYSVHLSDSYKTKKDLQGDIYNKIYDLLEDYVVNIIPIKKKYSDDNTFEKIKNECDELDKFAVGKSDNKDCIEKNMILLSISRQLFTHSLPLVAVEQCYGKLIDDTRKIIVDAKNDRKKEEAYLLLLELIKEYNLKLLSTKVYWEKPEEKEKYKKIWGEYSEDLSERDKEIICLKSDLNQLHNVEKDNSKIQKFYKEKLVEYGIMKTIKNTCRTIKDIKYTKKVLVK